MNKVEVRLIEWVETSVGVDDITTAVRHARTLGLSSRRWQNWKKKWMKGFRNNQVRRKGKEIQKGLRRFGETVNTEEEVFTSGRVDFLE